jgi:fructan beta-fructosidase
MTSTTRPAVPRILQNEPASSARPTAHFTAHNTWLNDPNGLLFHDGVYHLFFQNNPFGDTWGNISWGHATSTDLVSWTELPIAIPATVDEMAFSGSAVVDVRNTAGFAGPDETALVAIYTSARPPHADGPLTQAQSLAYSVDGGNSWTRYEGNPVLDIGSTEFRDPKVFWHGDEDGNWVMVAVEATRHRVVIYTSDDLISWTRQSHFGPAHAVGGVWECPDLFALTVEGTADTRWVLVVSLNPGSIAGGSGTQYFVGDFDGRTFVPERLSDSPEPATFDWLDYGRDYYAAVSFNGVPDGRRLMIGWASNWEYANETPTHPWRSSMSLVREINLKRHSDGRLRVTQQPVLPNNHPPISIFKITVPCAPGERTKVVLDGATDDHVVLMIDGDERTISADRTHSGAVDFHPAFASVDSAPLLTDAHQVALTIIIDATILEVFVDDGAVTLTQQIFPGAPLTSLRVEPLNERSAS